MSPVYGDNTAAIFSRLLPSKSQASFIEARLHWLTRVKSKKHQTSRYHFLAADDARAARHAEGTHAGRPLLPPSLRRHEATKRATSRLGNFYDTVPPRAGQPAGVGVNAT